ncbi:Uncharacterised protein [Mycobacterium tuberculosis]|uniref:Uncharacterized protein n=2 Tax=Mycobacterium tuberculosis TaxID=1773 RepID=A0A0U0SUD7_MYCTX|nr:Uncharacterised protein [Mycobacterium tuberculosis]CKT04173.1 Uncharacterised protein [Mycobacterium tuberculosis]CNL15611.1 Uncharacterised protein [Mycobacterium tuberculosis]CNL26988.1 Uncharacterised protein [Mycobacterium tuberculosis]CNL27923.1 Uncharacterised protein [Mycobacterium tuberculosis]
MSVVLPGKSADMAAATSAAPRSTSPRRAANGSAGQTASIALSHNGFRSSPAGADAHCSTTPQGSPAAAERSMMSLSSHRNSDGPRGFVPVGPQWWPDTSRVSSARVTATYNSRRSSSTRRRSSRRRCSEILSDNCFRSATADVSSTGMPCAPAEARSPRSSGGSSAGSVSQLLRDTVDGNTPRDRCATATTCHSKPLAACTVSTWTRSQATVNSAGGKPFSTTSATSK